VKKSAGNPSNKERQAAGDFYEALSPLIDAALAAAEDEKKEVAKKAVYVLIRLAFN
jgi:hypothetical protein